VWSLKKTAHLRVKFGIEMTQYRDEGQVDAVTQNVMQEVQHDMFNFLKSRLGNSHDAADVLQDFYVKVLTRFNDVRDNEKLRSWMYQVLKTTLIDHYRSRSKQRQSETDFHYLDTMLRSTDGIDELDAIVCMCLYKLLPTLKSEYADILWRADLIGEERGSIAATLNISESNVRVRLHRARLALRERLETTCRTCTVHGYLDCDCTEDGNMHAVAEKI
tara:strand:- start:15659 stop:16312 length:654 start_codon:yes stop_codon:yes gene_type:complete